MNARRIGQVIALVGAVTLLAGCATTRQTRSVETSGFLGDYSQLREGEGSEAQLVYIDERVDYSRYDAVWIDTVEIWVSEDTEGLSDEDAQQITDYAYAAFHDEMSQHFRIADGPGDDVLRLRIAVSEAKGSRVVGNAVTSIVPQLRLLTTLTGLATDAQVFVGRATGEFEVTDSVSGERLMAAVDERAGTKAVRGGILKWSDVKLAFDQWAEQARERFQELGIRQKTSAG
jgi:hypothetical protein